MPRSHSQSQGSFHYNLLPFCVLVWNQDTNAQGDPHGLIAEVYQGQGINMVAGENMPPRGHHTPLESASLLNAPQRWYPAIVDHPLPPPHPRVNRINLFLRMAKPSAGIYSGKDPGRSLRPALSFGR